MTMTIIKTQVMLIDKNYYHLLTIIFIIEFYHLIPFIIIINI